MSNRTFTMIKPEAVRAGATAEILKMITDNGFRIVALRMHHLSRNDAMRFYAVHKGKPFYEKLVEPLGEGVHPDPKSGSWARPGANARQAGGFLCCYSLAQIFDSLCFPANISDTQGLILLGCFLALLTSCA